jgi:hypothetical protein
MDRREEDDGGLFTIKPTLPGIGAKPEDDANHDKNETGKDDVDKDYSIHGCMC